MKPTTAVRANRGYRDILFHVHVLPVNKGSSAVQQRGHRFAEHNEETASIASWKGNLRRNILAESMAVPHIQQNKDKYVVRLVCYTYGTIFATIQS